MKLELNKTDIVMLMMVIGVMALCVWGASFIEMPDNTYLAMTENR